MILSTALSSTTAWILLGLICFSTLVEAGTTDPSIHWQVLETEHFKIIYDTKMKNTARLYAWQAERAYFFLHREFTEWPEKTHILISDTTDFSNGYATFFPYSLITVFPVLPSDMDSLGYYDNWAAELMIHEFTHILSFEPSNGFYTPFRYLFGSIVHPTGVLPTWWLEGLAVEMETRFTQHGRLRSPQYDAYLRNLVLNHSLQNETIDRINNSDIPSWPFGDRPYLLGSLLWNQIIKEEKSDQPKAPNYLLQRYSRRLPFLLNGPLEDLNGNTYAKTLQNLYQDLNQKVNEQIKTLQNLQSFDTKISSKNALPFLQLGINQHSPTLSPNQKFLVYLASTPKPRKEEIRILERNPKKGELFNNKKYKVLLNSMGASRVAWLPDSSGFFFTQAQTYKRYYTFKDLFYYDLNKSTLRRLTFGARVTDIGVSPDGQQLVMVQNEPSRSRLSLFNIKELKIIPIYKPKNLLTQISHPQFLDAHTLIFSRHDSKGKINCITLHLNSNENEKEIRPHLMIHEKGEKARQLHLTSKGLFFVSDLNGISNLYVAEKNLSTFHPLTNTQTEIINGDYDSINNQVIFSQLQADGYRLFSTPFSPLNTPLPSVSPLIEYPQENTSKTSEGPQLSQVQVNYKDYSSWPYLLPRYWIPFVYLIENGTLFQGTTSAGDPLGHHNYTFDASYDTVTQKPSLAFSYLNATTPIDWSLSASQIQQYLPSFNTTLTDRMASGLTYFHIPFLSDRFRGTLGYLYIETETPSSELNRQGPTGSIQYSTLLRENVLSTEEQNPLSENSHYNTQLNLGHTQYLEQENSVDYGRTTFSWNQIISYALPPGHQFVTQLRGAFAPDMEIQHIIALGDKTVGGNYLASLVNSSFLMRGYPSTTFIGRKIINGNFEYQFPLADLYRGPGLFPLFFRDLKTSLFIDGVAVDGAAYDSQLNGYVRSELRDNFWSGGLELKINTTIGYQFPVSFILGAYYGFDLEKQGGFHPFLGIGIDGLAQVNQNTKKSVEK